MHVRHIFILFFFFCTNLWARQHMFAPELRYYPTSDTRYFSLIQSFQGVWKTDEGEVYRVPFAEDEKKELNLTHTFHIEHIPQDTLWLSFAGIGVHAEVYLNGRLLDYLEIPFQTHIIPIPKPFIQLGQNRIQVKLGYQQLPNTWGIPSFIGIYRPIYLLQKSSIHSDFRYAAATANDSCLIYIPMTESRTYALDFDTFVRDIEKIKSKGVSRLFCPFGLTPKFRYYAIKQGFTFLNYLSSETSIAVYRLYATHTHWDGPVWVDKDSNPTPDFGKFSFFVKPKPVIRKIEIQKWELISIGIGWLLLLAVFKMSNPDLFKKLQSLWLDKRILDEITDGKYAIPLYSYMLLALKWLLKSMVISLLLLNIISEGKLIQLNIFNNPAFLYSYLEQYEGSFIGIFIPVAIGFALYGWVKYALLYFASTIYQVKDLVGKQRNIELLSEFPFLWVVYASGFLYFSAPIGWQAFFSYFMYFIYLLWIIRKFSYTIISLEQVIRMPYSVVFLYICTFEVLPWLLLL